ncbi:MAG TPA: GFA family protein [Xanthobacteraceae bacterium]|nr:GFA family protein [Xanthobacteraceae bacterium]
MTTRYAACNCGQLRLACEGEPARISMCHCLECQRRTGSVFSNQAWFDRQQITSISGNASEFRRTSDSGNALTFRFCPVCGSTVYWEAEGFPGLIAVAVGSFADPSFPAPKHSVWERRRHHWVPVFGDMPIQHSN